MDPEEPIGGDCGRLAYGLGGGGEGPGIWETGGTADGGDIIRGGGACPTLGGGGTDGARGPPTGGGPVGGGPWLRVGDWLGNGEAMGAAAAAGVERRGVGAFAKPSGKSFHAGRPVAVVYVVMGGLAGDWFDARGGGGTPAPAGCPPNADGGP